VIIIILFFIFLFHELISYAESVGASYFNTSAKLNKNVNEIFLDLSKRMLEQSLKEQEDTPSTTMSFQNTSPTTTKKTLKFEQADTNRPAEGGGCC
jgi:Ras-related protein Rab-21